MVRGAAGQSILNQDRAPGVQAIRGAILISPGSFQDSSHLCHAGDASAHHIRYTGGEAQAAVDDGTYLKLSPLALQTIVGDTNHNGVFSITQTGQSFLNPKVRNLIVNDGAPAVAVKGSWWLSPSGKELRYSDGVSWILGLSGV